MNLKINERSNVERPNLRELLKQEIKVETIDFYQRIGKIESIVDENFQNLPIFRAKLRFSKLKKLYIFQIVNYGNLLFSQFVNYGNLLFFSL